MDLSVSTVRPSLLDSRFSGDAWVVDQKDGTFDLCLGNYVLTNVRGMEWDLPVLNHMFERLRRRHPQPERKIIRFLCRCR